MLLWYRIDLNNAENLKLLTTLNVVKYTSTFQLA